MSYHSDARNRQNILQDIQQQKQHLLQQSSSSGSSIAGTSTSTQAPRTTKFESHAPPPHAVPPMTRRTAIEYATAYSSGFFITQDSAHGNPILPVIPRVDDS